MAPDAVRALAKEQPGAAAAVGQVAVTLLEANGRQVPLTLLAWTAEAAATIGDGSMANALLAKGGGRIDAATRLTATNAASQALLRSILIGEWSP